MFEWSAQAEADLRRLWDTGLSTAKIGEADGRHQKHA